MLRSMPPSLKKTWASCLGLLSLAFNSRVHSTLEVSPYLMVMGRSPTLPVDLLLPPPDQIVGNTEDDLQARFRAVFQYVSNAKKAAYRITARTYTGKVRNFEPGQLCWFFLLDNKSAPISGRKTLNSWSGPMVVTKREGRSLYRIKADRVPGAREFVAHVTRLFLY